MEVEKLDGGLSALTEVLGLLADDFECHPLSRSIDDCEAAGRAMREAKSAIERLVAAIETTLDENGHLADGEDCTLIALKRAIESEPHPPHRQCGCTECAPSFEPYPDAPNAKA